MPKFSWKAKTDLWPISSSHLCYDIKIEHQSNTLELGTKYDSLDIYVKGLSFKTTKFIIFFRMNWLMYHKLVFGWRCFGNIELSTNPV